MADLLAPLGVTCGYIVDDDDLRGDINFDQRNHIVMMKVIRHICFAISTLILITSAGDLQKVTLSVG